MKSYKIKLDRQEIQIREMSKPGGLDSRDQSKSRSRLSLVSRSTFLKCQDFLDGRELSFFSGFSFLLRYCLDSKGEGGGHNLYIFRFRETDYRVGKR